MGRELCRMSREYLSIYLHKGGGRSAFSVRMRDFGQSEYESLG